MKKYLPNDALWIMLETGKAGIADCVAFEHIANKSYVLQQIMFYYGLFHNPNFNQNTHNARSVGNIQLAYN